MEAARVVVVTGGNKGIGLETLRKLAGAGQEGLVLVLACRNAERAAQAQGVLASEFPSQRFETMTVDLESAESVDRFVRELGERFPAGVDVLINNAAVMFNSRSELPFEAQAGPTMTVNLFNTHRLMQAALPLLLKRPAPKMINVVSQLGRSAFEGSSAAVQARWRAAASDEDVLGLAREYMAAVADGSLKDKGFAANNYGTSKLALIALTRVLAAREPGLVAVSCCPGWCQTDMGGPGAIKTAEAGADTPAFLAATASKEASGKFFQDRKDISFLSASG